MPESLRDRGAVLFLVLGAAFAVNVVLAELIGVKLFQLEHALGQERADFRLFGHDHLSFVLSVGVLPWPLVFVITDVVNDYYGVRGVRLLTLLTTVLVVLAFVLLWAAIELPADLGWWVASGKDQGVPDMQAAFAAIFGQSKNIIIGSLAAFMIGQLVDAFVFRALKRATGGKKIWLRATGSTVVSQLLDSLVVTYVAFAVFRGMPWGQATALALTAYTYKFVVAILATPVVYLGHALVERWLGHERAAAMRAAALAERH